MRAYCSDRFVLPLPLPPGHRFPMAKYARLRSRVAAEPPPGAVQLELAPAASDEEILRAHDAGWLHAVVDGTLSPRQQRDIGFPWSPQMVERSRRSVASPVRRSPPAAPCSTMAPPSTWPAVRITRSVTTERATACSTMPPSPRLRCRPGDPRAGQAIFLAGADPYAGDRLGRLSLSLEGLAQRGRLMFERCARASLPVAACMAGGYARDIDETVDIHLRTVRIAAGC